MNNYEYLNKIKTSQEEQDKLTQELKKELDSFILTTEEQEKIISNTLEKAFKSYIITNPVPFIKYLKIKLKKEVEEKYLTPSALISIDDQKIIKLYLTDINNRFLTEEEIRKRLQIDSKAIYHALMKLKDINKEELEKLFPNYKYQIKKRKEFFKRSITLSEQNLLYIGYYIGEVNDLCLDVEEIAKLENKSIAKIKKELTIAFNLLKDTKNLQLVLEKYPNSERMLEIKATNLGVHLTIPKEKKNYPVTKQNKKTVKRSLLSKTEQQLVEELQKYPYDKIPLDKVAKNLEKSKQEISNLIYRLKKKCQNQQIKELIETLIPNFLNLKSIRKKSQTNTKKQKNKKTNLTSLQIKLLEELNKHKKNSISYHKLAELTGYKNSQVIYQTIRSLKLKSKKNPRLKAEIESIYPEFLEEKKSKSQKTKNQKVPKTNLSPKNFLQSKELTVLEGLYRITPPSKTYTTQQELARKLSLTTARINNIKKSALSKIDSNPTIEEQIKKTWTSFTEDRIIKENYSKKKSITVKESDLENIKSFIRQYDISEVIHEKKKNAILNGIHNLEESTFKNYVVKCTEEQKAILALRLGYINAPIDSKSIAEIFKIEEEEVITLTKNCLQNKLTECPQKVYQKKES